MIEQDGLMCCVKLHGLGLEGDLTIPKMAGAIVVFAHGSGSDRNSTRNQYVAKVINNSGIATLLVDLLTREEKEIDAKTKHMRFDIDLLATRMEAITRWLKQKPETEKLPIGFFGSSTGAAAALISASRLKSNANHEVVTTIVSRGGRPDLAESEVLNSTAAATLFIVGENDTPVIEMNKRAMKQLKNTQFKELVIIPGASHFFEEQGAMERVAQVAVRWFEHHLLGSGTTFHSEYVYKASNHRNFFSSLKAISGIHMKFKDRTTAGKILVSTLRQYKDDERKSMATVIGISRGGAIVGRAVAAKLSADFDVVVVRRLRNPSNSEDAIGAITHGGFAYIDTKKIESLGISKDYIEMERRKQMKEVERRISLYRPDKRDYKIKDRRVILVDDGSATGASIIVTARWIRTQHPRELIAAVPVISKQAADLVKGEVDKIRIVRSPQNFQSVEQFYQDFRPVTDEHIINIINE